MNGVHDLGGMHGFGAVVREENEPVFHEPWEGRVYAMIRQLNVKLPPSGPGAGLRDIIEKMGPSRYLSSSYYERFLEVLERRALAEGVVTKAELESRMKLIDKGGRDPVLRSEDSEAVEQVLIRLKTNQSRPEQAGSVSCFAKGDEVVRET